MLAFNISANHKCLQGWQVRKHVQIHNESESNLGTIPHLS